MKVFPLHQKQRLYFHHMVATGGNTLALTLAASEPSYHIVHLTNAGRNICDSPDCLNLTSTHSRTLFYGHNLFGLIEKNSLPDKYFTVLRNPYERLISDFFWMATNNFKKSAYESLRDFESFVMESEHLEFYIHHCGDLNYDNKQHFDIEECSRIPNDLANTIARRNLNEQFWMVGITEMFEETLFYIKYCLGNFHLSKWWHHRAPKTPYRPAFMDLSKALRRQIEDKTQFDMALYEDCRRAFETRFSSIDMKRGFVDYFNCAHPV